MTRRAAIVAGAAAFLDYVAEGDVQLLVYSAFGPLLDQRGAEWMQAGTEEPAGHEGVLLHEPPGIVF
ncbi:MAG: hypothetical protein IH942_07025 [Acidobacteria bacterium]|nr:hypothetical protein [Acidobacteriota bacterium]